MHKLLLKNIKTLVGTYEQAPDCLKGEQMKELPTIDGAWLACEDGRIADFGNMKDFPGISDWKDLEVKDCSGKIVMPCFADSHTHLVYAGNREREFEDRLKGLSYENIAKRGGGILNSANKLRETPEDQLFEESLVRFKEIISQGTGAVEIKSGYGLDLKSELKMLRVIRRLRNLNWIPVKATFLGAHAVPLEYKDRRADYIKMLVSELLPEISKEGLADFIDIFCEKGYFDEYDTRKVLEAGKKFGLQGKVHSEQMSHSNGTKTAAECGALSADHLEFVNDDDIAALKRSGTIPTILPGAALFLDLPLPPARKLIDNGLPVAFASDYNPGSCPTGNMKLVMSLACIQYKLMPEEAMNAVTLNSARAMDLHKEVGTITPGKRANFIITKDVNSVGFLSYAFGSDLIGEVFLNGKKWQ
jgi:imidazolonepropionase